MPFYDYLCLDCLSKHADAAISDSAVQACMFETRHQMFPSDAELTEARRCPTCKGVNTEICPASSNVSAFVRGINWEEYKRDRKNLAAMRRDMALYQLQTDDPYAKYRAPGEASDLEHRLGRPS